MCDEDELLTITFGGEKVTGSIDFFNELCLVYRLAAKTEARDGMSEAAAKHKSISEQISQQLSELCDEE